MSAVQTTGVRTIWLSWLRLLDHLHVRGIQPTCGYDTADATPTPDIADMLGLFVAPRLF